MVVLKISTPFRSVKVTEIYTAYKHQERVSPTYEALSVEIRWNGTYPDTQIECARLDQESERFLCVGRDCRLAH